ncbi:MAG TPA: SDR family NAD(P)-dependent oxidoreductase [Thiomonas arsenitoxydans]|uniref:NAD-dependent epimerase/dehydratase family protein n=1 Tax=Thiomonas TaxID=32012 RepID=UPI002580396D|nr:MULTISPECIES: NAD-dependent epimerase/dehydratase family protein [Thiomonas]HML80877.1 SDR family NAD(P)-dependent oxidoreductase [Thiomonas arsenitoxydans]
MNDQSGRGRPRLLIVGCGDIGMRVAALARGRYRLLALTSSPQRLESLRSAGIVPLVGNLDQPQTLWRLAQLAPQRVLMLAPPGDTSGPRDQRSRHLISRLKQSGMLSGPGKNTLRVVYASTSGVYGDCQGELAPETRPCLPQTERAQRRCDAERLWRRAGVQHRWRVGLLRIPGIYDGGSRSPKGRLERGLPVLTPADDVYTNHIHADDLARLCLLALERAAPGRVYNVCDDSALRMGDYFDLAADLYGLPRPQRVARDQAQASGLSPMMLSFMRESRRLDNTRMKAELRARLRYPEVLLGLRSGKVR